MKEETLKIERLIRELKVNDEKEASDYEETPEEPKEAMNALVKIGEAAVEPLLELLKDTSRYSCLYAIKVLGEIRDPRAVQPIIEAFSSEGFGEAFELAEDYDQPKLALQKIGLLALEPTLAYLREMKESDDELGMCEALEILAGIKDEKSFRALVDMLSHPHSEVQATSIILLGEYGNKKAVEYLKKLLENIDARNSVADAIRKLVSAREYRKIIAPYPFADLDSYRREIDKCLSDIEYARKYPSRFEGDNAEEFNALSQECKIRDAVNKLLHEAIELAVYEAVISEDMYQQLDTTFWKLREKWREFEREHEEEIAIINGYIPGVEKKVMTRSYKGLVRTSWGPNPKLDGLRAKIWEWLKRQEFLVTKEYSHLWARKCAKGGRKGCYVAVVVDEDKPRTWGLVHLNLWGEGWTTREMKTFTTSFWQYIDKIATELVGKKRFQVRILED